MKVKVLWQVLQALLEEMKHQYHTSDIFAPIDSDSVTDYYFLTDRTKVKNKNCSTIGWALQQAFPTLNIAEKSVYNYVYIPASKQRNQFFFLEKRYPSIFFKYIGFNGIEAFLDWCETSQKLSPDILQQQWSLLNQHKTQKSQYYFCYFPQGNQLVEAVAIFKNWRTLQIKYKDKQGQQVQLSGKVELKQKQLCVSLSADFQSGLKQDKVITFLSIFRANLATEPPSLLQGTYAGTNDKGRPVAGKIIFEKITESIAKTAEPNFETHKHPHLLHQQLIIQHVDSSSPTIDQALPKNRQKQLEKLAGIYRGYICIPKNNQPTIVEAISIIRPDGTADCKGYSNIFYSGCVEVFSGGGYAKLATYTEDGAHQFTYLLELKYTGANVLHMEGIYVGSFKNKLVNGREYFERLFDYSPEKEAIINVELKEFPFAKLLEKRADLAKKLQTFFVREGQYQLLQQLNRPLDSQINQKRVAGVFLLYFYSSAQNIRKYVLKIDVDTSQAWLKTNNQLHEGAFLITGNFLIVRLQALGNSGEYLTQLVTFIGNNKENPELKIMEGIVAGLSDDDYIQRPVSVRCLIIRTKIEFNWVNSEQINLGSPAFETLNKNPLLPNLGNYLAGNHRNYIATHPQVNFRDLVILSQKSFSNCQKGNHAKAMFKAACFTALEIDTCLAGEILEEKEINRLTDEFILQVSEAFQHGFGQFKEDLIFFEQQQTRSLKKFANAFIYEYGTFQLDLCKFYRSLPTPSLSNNGGKKYRRILS